MLIYGCLIFIQKGAPVPGTVPGSVRLRSQRQRAVGRAGDTDEDGKYPVSKSLPAYLDFHDLNLTSTDFGNYRSAISLNLHICL